ncbi:unnamed protein product, partial [Rotaria sordida]
SPPRSDRESAPQSARKSPPRSDRESPPRSSLETLPPAGETLLPRPTSKTSPPSSEIPLSPTPERRSPPFSETSAPPTSYTVRPSSNSKPVPSPAKPLPPPTSKPVPPSPKPVPPPSAAKPVPLPAASKRVPPPASLKTVLPTASETIPPPVVSAAAVPPPSSPSALLDLMKKYVQSKVCYNSAALTNARVTNVKQGCIAYQIDLSTLVESRSLEKLEKPYNGESTPAQALLNAWDYEFQQPTTLKKYQKDTHDLIQASSKAVCPECKGATRFQCSSCGGNGRTACHYCSINASTQNSDQMYDRSVCSYCNNTRVTHCSTCNSTGAVDCTRCGTHGYILQWYQLTIEWYTIHSISLQSNTSLPAEIIYKAPGKQSCWQFDQKWSNACSFNNYFQSVFAKQRAEFPVKLDSLTEDFTKNHLEKVQNDGLIIRLKCEIQKLDIIEVEYEAEGFINKTDENMGMFLLTKKF